MLFLQAQVSTSTFRSVYPSFIIANFAPLTPLLDDSNSFWLTVSLSEVHDKKVVTLLNAQPISIALSRWSGESWWIPGLTKLIKLDSKPQGSPALKQIKTKMLLSKRRVTQNHKRVFQGGRSWYEAFIYERLNRREERDWVNKLILERTRKISRKNLIGIAKDKYQMLH